MSKKHYIPTAEYYFYILLSVIDICVGGFCAIRLGLNILDGSAFNKVPATFNTGVVNRFHITPIVWNVIYIFAIVLCVIAYPFVSRKRQELRDKVEYDENGVSRKHGSFSQLSKAERDAIEQQKMIDMERILPSSLVKSITHIGSEHPEEDLERLIGLSVVKEEVKRMVARMEFEQGNHKHKNGETHTLTSMNMILTGNPGTGKTEISRIMAAFLYKYGYIKKNQSIEVDGNFFNGLSAGESSKRTSALIRAARDGVLFIDEAYALLTGGQEVIATLVKDMEDFRNDTVFIFAGYEREMKTFIESNSGIQSRVKYNMHFVDYSVEELKSIFTLMANEAGFCVTEEALDKFEQIMARRRLERNFGNARDVRNILDKAVDTHAVHVKEGIDENARFYILGSDL